MIYFAADEDRLPLLEHYLASRRGESFRGRIRQLTYAELFRRRELERGTWIFTALEALTGAELRMADRIQQAARAAGLAVLNPALEVLRRYELLRKLHGMGYNSFRVARGDEPADGLRFPVFVREADEHTGSLTPLLSDRDALRSALRYLRMRGLARRQLLIVEFCETVDGDGQYRKYSFSRLGASFFPRYLHQGRGWINKDRTRTATIEAAREEMDYLNTNPHGEWAREMFELARIDYGRLDYGVQQGRPQLWEINTAPVLVVNPAVQFVSAELEQAHKLFDAGLDLSHARMRAAFEKLDPGPMEGRVAYDFPRELVEEARRQRRAAERRKRLRRSIDRLAAARGLNAIGPWLRRSMGW